MNIFSPEISPESQGDVLVDTRDERPAKVVVHNDEVNTFDWVIQCFTLWCQHTPNQAAQCAMIIHETGKCTVKEGAKSEMQEIADNLKAQGLKAECVVEED